MTTSLSRNSWFRYAWGRVRLAFQLPPPRYLIEYQMTFPRLQGVRLRQYVPEDFDACRELYELNATERFPQDVELDQVRYLRQGLPSNLIAELDGRIIGCGGYVLQHPDFATFVYGLVHPEFQKMGVGRLLMFGRLAQLPVIGGDTTVAICTVKKARSYYEQFDFKVLPDPWKDSKGGEHPMAALCVNAYIICAARRYLETLGIPFPDLRHIPPLRSHLVNEPDPEATVSAPMAYEH